MPSGDIPPSMASLPYRSSRQPSRQSSRQASMDTRDDIQIHQDHYIGIDVGTGSARACIIDAKGNIVGLASENIGLWQPQQGYYVRMSDRASSVFLTVALTVRQRNNQQTISGDAYACLFSALSANITSTRLLSAELGSTLRAHWPFSPRLQTSPYLSPGRTLILTAT